MDFSDFIPTGQRFYTELAANNDKAWWAENRTTYDDVLKPMALALLDDIAPRLSEILDEEVTTKLFRPYRDTRFSKDKTPFKPHLHVLWQVMGGRQPVAYFFGIEPDGARIGGGIMTMEKPVLEDWRKFVDLDGPRVASILSGVEAKGFTFRPPELARCPRGYPADHPNLTLLRHKSIIATRSFENSAPLTDRILDGFMDFRPLGDLLTTVVCA